MCSLRSDPFMRSSGDRVPSRFSSMAPWRVLGRGTKRGTTWLPSTKPIRLPWTLRWLRFGPKQWNSLRMRRMWRRRTLRSMFCIRCGWEKWDMSNPTSYVGEQFRFGSVDMTFEFNSSHHQVIWHPSLVLFPIGGKRTRPASCQPNKRSTGYKINQSSSQKSSVDVMMYFVPPGMFPKYSIHWIGGRCRSLLRKSRALLTWPESARTRHQ